MSVRREAAGDRKSTRLNSSHLTISYAVFCLKKKKPILRGALLHEHTITLVTRTRPVLVDRNLPAARVVLGSRGQVGHARPLFFFFNDTATTEIYTLSLHDALPICSPRSPVAGCGRRRPRARAAAAAG